MRPQHGSGWLLLGTALAFAALRAAADDAGNVPEDNAPQSTQVLVCAKPGDAPAGYLQQWVKDALTKLPAGYKVQITLVSVYDPSPNKIIQYPHSIVPLDPEGKPDGLEEFRRPFSWAVVASAAWKHGLKDGPERVYETDGKTSWLTSEIPWQQGRIHGVKRTFFTTGKPQTETTYEHGVPSGPARSFDQAGRVTREALMKTGKRDGTMTDFWPETGKPKRVVEYRQGQVVGVTREYYANGQLKRELPFRDNLMDGVEKEYEADGKLIRERYWRAGEAITKEQFAK